MIKLTQQSPSALFFLDPPVFRGLFGVYCGGLVDPILVELEPGHSEARFHINKVESGFGVFQK